MNDNRKAKVATYNANTGEGLLLIENMEKINFSINDWEDFNTLPEIGLLVEIDKNNKIKLNSQVFSDIRNKQNILKLKEQYINNLDGSWKIRTNDENGFSLTCDNYKDDFSIGKFILISILLSIPLGVFLSYFGVILAIIISFMISKSSQVNEDIINGKIDYNKLQIIIKMNTDVLKVLTVKRVDK